MAFVLQVVTVVPAVSDRVPAMESVSRASNGTKRRLARVDREHSTPKV